MSYEGVNNGNGWKDAPSTDTPRNAKNFNIMEAGIKLAHTLIASIQAQVNQIVKTGDSSVEAAQARVTVDGTTYDTLRDRLNAGDADVAKKATYYDLDTQTGTALHFTNAEDAVVEVTKIEGATTMSVAEPTPDNSAVITNASNFDLVACGKNFFNPNDTEDIWNYVSTRAVNGDSITITSTNIDDLYGYFGYHKKLEPNAEYRIHYSSTRTGADGGGISIYNRDVNVPIVSSPNTLNGDYTFVTPSDGWISILLYCKAGTASIESATFSNVQLELGSVATPYESYKSNKVTLSYEMPELPNGVCDTIEKGSDGKWRYIQRIKKTTLVGTEDWTQFSADDTYIKAYIYDTYSKMHLSVNVICNMLSAKSYTDLSEGIFMGDAEDCGIVLITIKKSRLTSPDISGLKTWLTSNHITAYYQLATPVETVVDDIYLTSYAGITNVLTSAVPQVAISGNAKSQLWNDMRIIKKQLTNLTNAVVQLGGTV